MAVECMLLKEKNKRLIFEDGTYYDGYAFGSNEEAVLEIVFNTSVVGYQEILSDPSYTDQGVVMTYPLIGNYGMADDDYETDIPTIGGLIVREYNDEPSNFRSKETLSTVMERYNVVGISGIDTRKLTRYIRNFGSRKALITSIETSVEEGVKKLNESELATDQVSRVSRKAICKYNIAGAKKNVVAIDCGMKLNIVRQLNAHGCNVTMVPYNTDIETIQKLHPDGIFISNGPGDPTDVKETIETVKALIGKYPIFGICLGHQIISLAYGAKTYKLKFGHRGGNHPVLNIKTGRVEITSQNHSYAVDTASLEGTGLSVTHMNLLDNTVEGVENRLDKVFGVQYHPESAPGPQDSDYLFDYFLDMMEG